MTAMNVNMGRFFLSHFIFLLTNSKFLFRSAPLLDGHNNDRNEDVEGKFFWSYSDCLPRYSTTTWASENVASHNVDDCLPRRP